MHPPELDDFMPWKALLSDRDIQKSVVLALLPLLKYLPVVINHLRLRRIEKKLDGVLHDKNQVVKGRQKPHSSSHRS